MIKNLKFVVTLILLSVSTFAFANTDKSNGTATASLSSNKVALGEEVTLTVTVTGIKSGENKYKITIPSGITAKSGQAAGVTTEYATSSDYTKTIGKKRETPYRGARNAVSSSLIRRFAFGNYSHEKDINFPEYADCSHRYGSSHCRLSEYRVGYLL